MNPKKLGKLDNHKQEPWKLPLPEFIEELYYKRFRKERPDAVLSIEQRARRRHAKKQQRKGARRLARSNEGQGTREQVHATPDGYLSESGAGGSAAEFVATNDEDIPFIVGFDVSLDHKVSA
jgi:hypothetical protein